MDDWLAARKKSHKHIYLPSLNSGVICSDHCLGITELSCINSFYSGLSSIASFHGWLMGPELIPVLPRTFQWIYSVYGDTEKQTAKLKSNGVFTIINHDSSHNFYQVRSTQGKYPTFTDSSEKKATGDILNACPC